MNNIYKSNKFDASFEKFKVMSEYLKNNMTYFNEHVAESRSILHDITNGRNEYKLPIISINAYQNIINDNKKLGKFKNNSKDNIQDHIYGRTLASEYLYKIMIKNKDFSIIEYDNFIKKIVSTITIDRKIDNKGISSLLPKKNTKNKKYLSIREIYKKVGIELFYFEKIKITKGIQINLLNKIDIDKLFDEMKNYIQNLLN